MSCFFLSGEINVASLAQASQRCLVLPPLPQRRWQREMTCHDPLEEFHDEYAIR